MPVSTRQVHFAGSAIAIQADGAAARRLVDFLFGELPEHGAPPPRLTYRLEAGDQPGRFSLHLGETCLLREARPAQAAARLMDRACFHLADTSQDGLLLHAALLSWQGQGLLLPGSSGRGKSTLSAWLVQQGFDYLTDELAYIPSGATAAFGLRRPLNIKSVARPLLEALVGPPGIDDREDILRSSGSYMTAVQALRPGAAAVASVPVRWIVFPAYQAGIGLEVEALSRARCGLALMEGLINARNLPGHGLDEIGRLARQAPAWKIRYEGFEVFRRHGANDDGPAFLECIAS
ncbi:MAG: hypothetical protein ACKOC5_18600 [Chloroflexota bacterium]